MSRTLTAPVIFSLTFCMAACVGGHRGGTTDAGTPDSGHTTTDGGPGSDTGIMLMDSGPGHDSGPTGHDSGPPGGDAGMCGAAVPRVPAGTTYCDMATYTCLTAASCTTTACITGCYATDSHGTDCQNCVQQDNIACANANGCATQWHDLDCCISLHCPTGSAMDCGMTMCGSQTTAYDNCYTANGPGSASMPACGADAAACFGM